MEEYFEIGQIVNTNGLKGVLKIKPFTDDITKFERLKTIYIDKASSLLEFKIEKVRYNKNMVMIKLEGIETIEEAKKYRNCFVKIKREQEEPLEDGVYYISDLLKCEVFTEEGVLLGSIVDVFPTGSNDVYVVKNEEGKQILIPAIGEVVVDVDTNRKKIVIKVMKGLL